MAYLELRKARNVKIFREEVSPERVSREVLMEFSETEEALAKEAKKYNIKGKSKQKWEKNTGGPASG